MGTLCLVQAVQQQYSLIAAAYSADMASHKLRRTNCVESIRHMGLLLISIALEIAMLFIV